VDGLKSQLTARLSRGRSVRFSDQLEPRYFEELASERCVVRYRKRIPGKRAEDPSRRPRDGRLRLRLHGAGLGAGLVLQTAIQLGTGIICLPEWGNWNDAIERFIAGFSVTGLAVLSIAGAA